MAYLTHRQTCKKSRQQETAVRSLRAILWAKMQIPYAEPSVTPSTSTLMPNASRRSSEDDGFRLQCRAYENSTVPDGLASRRSSRLLLLRSAAEAVGSRGALGEGLAPLQVPWLPRLDTVAPAAGVVPDGPG